MLVQKAPSLVTYFTRDSNSQHARANKTKDETINNLTR